MTFSQKKKKKVGITSIILFFSFIFQPNTIYHQKTVYFIPLRLTSTFRESWTENSSDLCMPHSKGLGGGRVEQMISPEMAQERAGLRNIRWDMRCYKTGIFSLCCFSLPHSVG